MGRTQGLELFYKIYKLSLIMPNMSKVLQNFQNFTSWPDREVQTKNPNPCHGAPTLTRMRSKILDISLNFRKGHIIHKFLQMKKICA